MSGIEISEKSIALLKLQERIRWVKTAPQRNCKSCKYMKREGMWDQFFYCKKHKFRTMGMAVCEDFVRSKSK